VGPYKILNDFMVTELIKSAAHSDVRRARINFHPSANSTVQEMLICAFPDTTIDIHGHYQKSESFCVLSGLLDIFLFEESGPILLERVTLGSDLGSCYYRLDGPNPHLVVPRSKPTIFLEVTSGPFVKGENSYRPSWGLSFNVENFLREFYNDGRT